MPDHPARKSRLSKVLGLPRGIIRRSFLLNGHRLEKAGADQKQVKASGGRHPQPYRGDFENPETGLAGVAGHVVDQKVGRGSDERQGAAEHRRIGQRHQKEFRGLAERLGRVANDWRRKHHDRSVVEERRS
jgi:hypothetical protein